MVAATSKGTTMKLSWEGFTASDSLGSQSRDTSWQRSRVGGDLIVLLATLVRLVRWSSQLPSEVKAPSSQLRGGKWHVSFMFHQCIMFRALSELMTWFYVILCDVLNCFYCISIILQVFLDTRSCTVSTHLGLQQCETVLRQLMPNTECLGTISCNRLFSRKSLNASEVHSYLTSRWRWSMFIHHFWNRTLGTLDLWDGIMSRFLLALDALPRRLDQHMPTATDATTTDSCEGRASTSKAHVVSDVKPMRETKGRNRNKREEHWDILMWIWHKFSACQLSGTSPSRSLGSCLIRAWRWRRGLVTFSD